MSGYRRHFHGLFYQFWARKLFCRRLCSILMLETYKNLLATTSNTNNHFHLSHCRSPSTKRRSTKNIVGQPKSASPSKRVQEFCRTWSPNLRPRKNINNKQFCFFFFGWQTIQVIVLLWKNKKHRIEEERLKKKNRKKNNTWPLARPSADQQHLRTHKTNPSLAPARVLCDLFVIVLC